MKHLRYYCLLLTLLQLFPYELCQETVFDVADLARGGIKNRRKVNRCQHPLHAWMCQSIPPLGRSINSRKTSETQISFRPPPSVTPSTLAVTLPPDFFLTTPVGSSQQLVLTSQVVSESPKKKSLKYNKCSHPFHSWQCRNGGRRKTEKLSKQILPKVTTTPVPVSSKPKIVKKAKLLSESRGKSFTRSKEINTKPKHSSGDYHQCNHAFHSWLCSKNTPQKVSKIVRRPSNNIGKSLITNVVSITIPSTTPLPLFTSSPEIIRSPTTVPPSSVKESYKKCNHAFHAWLCPTKPRPSPIKRPTTTTEAQPGIGKSLVRNNSNKNNETKYLKSKINQQTTKPSYNKCNHAFHSWMCDRRGTPRPPTRKPSSNIGKSLIQNPSQKHLPEVTPPSVKSVGYTYNKGSRCSHPFHSWLCQKSKPVPKRVIPKPRKINMEKQIHTTIETTIKPEKITVEITTDPCNDPLETDKCQPSTTATTTQKTEIIPDPIIKLGKSLDREDSSPKVLTNHVMKPKPSKPIDSSWDGTNPCSHAFHAWLCQPLIPRLTFRPPKFNLLLRTELPNKGKSLESEGSATTIEIRETTPSTTTKEYYQKLTTTSEKPKGRSLIDFKEEKKIDDPCNHPFHSWRCYLFGGRAATFNIKDIPNISALPLEDESSANSINSVERRERNARVSESAKPLLLNSTETSRNDRRSNSLQFKVKKQNTVRRNHNPVQKNVTQESSSAKSSRRKPRPRIRQQKIRSNVNLQSQKMYNRHFVANLNTFGVSLDILSPLLFESQRIPKT